MRTSFSDRSTATTLAATGPDAGFRHAVAIVSFGVVALAAVAVGLAFEVTAVAALGGLALVAATVAGSHRWLADED